MNGPLVSVVIPVYNMERYLGEAIESVLAQSWPHLELIVVDDGSSDSSALVARRFGPRVRLCQQANAGLAAARNAGVRLAGGELLAQLDADDLWPPDSLARRVAALAADPAAAMATGHVRQLYSPETGAAFRSRIACQLEPMPAYQMDGLLIRREAFERVGWHDTAWRVGSDMDWFIRARDLGLRVVMLPEVVFLRRIHEHNMGLTHRELGRQRLQILKAALDRRRAAASQPPQRGND